jgi:hypothetical protein
MRLGGGSTKITNILKKISQDIKIAKSFFTNYYTCVFLKIFRKIFQIKLLARQIKNNNYVINLSKNN